MGLTQYTKYSCIPLHTSIPSLWEHKTSPRGITSGIIYVRHFFEERNKGLRGIISFLYNKLAFNTGTSDKVIFASPTGNINNSLYYGGFLTLLFASKAERATDKYSSPHQLIYLKS